MSLPSPVARATVLVTGASSGIGAELARQLAARGHNLTLVARRRDRLEALAKDVRGVTGVHVDVRKVDLAVQAQRTRLIKALREGDLRVEVLCNNAGFGTYGKFQSLPQDREAEEVRLNVAALHELTGALVPDMVDRGRGAVLNTASIAGFQPLPNQATYAATKAFVVAFSEALHSDLAGTGVSCTALCPGPVRTEFVEVAGMEAQAEWSPDFVWVSAAEAARAGIEGMAHGKRVVFPGMVHRAAATGGRLTPRALLLPLAERLGRLS